MMLEHLGEKEAADRIIKSIEKTLANKKSRTKDLGGDSNTSECAKEIVKNLT